MKYNPRPLIFFGSIIISMFLWIGRDQAAGAHSASAMSGWKLPLPAGNYYVIQGDYDSSTYTHHNPQPALKCAIDLTDPRGKGKIEGTLLLAPAGGKVSKIDYQEEGAGNYLNIIHDDGTVSQYFHLQTGSIVVKVGDRVTEGMSLARIDDTGNSTESHLHFVVYTDDTRKECIKFENLDSNTDFRTRSTISSSNVSTTDLPEPTPSIPLQPAPSLPPSPGEMPNSGSCSASIIDNYLNNLSSPLAGKGQRFVDAGRKYNVDPRFIVAISYAESSLGKKICAPYNAWGVMKPGTNTCQSFSSWEDSIDRVTALVGYNYLPKGQNNIPSFVIKPAGTCTSHCYCASGCNNWVPNVSDAYKKMRGDPITQDLTLVTCSGNVDSKNNPPNKPFLVSPGDWAEFNTSSPQLCAKHNGDPDTGDSISGYFFQIFESAQNWDSGWVTSSCINSTFLGTYSYQWHVKVKDSQGVESTWSDTWHFTIKGGTSSPTQTPSKTLTPTIMPTPRAQIPSPPTLREPVNNKVLSTQDDIWFSWNYSQDAEEFYLEYWGGPYDTLNSNWITDTAYHIGTMWAGTISWHVKARNATGVSDWSKTWSFTIKDQSTTTPTQMILPSQTPQPTPSKDQSTTTPTQMISPSQTLQSTSSPSVTLVPADTTKSDGDYTSPNNGDVVGCTVHLAAWASDDQSGVKEVHFTAKWNDRWSLVKNDTSSPYEYDWDMCADSVPDGDIEIGLDIFDNAGNEFNLSTKHTNLHITKKTQTETGNIASKANLEPNGIGSDKAFDGDLGTFWTDGLGHRFTLKLSWNEKKNISRIIVWDRPQNSPDNNQINTLMITLSNGVSKSFGMDSQGKLCVNVAFSPIQSVDFITLKADDASGNNGLSEVEIWVGDKTSGTSCLNAGSMP